MFWWDFRVSLCLSHGSRRGHISRAPVRCHGERWMKQRRPRHSCSSLFSLSPRAHKAHFKAWKAHAGHLRAAGPERGEWQTLPPPQPQPFVNMHPHALFSTHLLHFFIMHLWVQCKKYMVVACLKKHDSPMILILSADCQMLMSFGETQGAVVLIEL